MKKFKVYSWQNLLIGIGSALIVIFKLGTAKQFMDYAWVFLFGALMLRAFRTALTENGVEEEKRRSGEADQFWEEEYNGRRWISWIPVVLVGIALGLALFVGFKTLWLVVILMIAALTMELRQVSRMTKWKVKQEKLAQAQAKTEEAKNPAPKQ